LPRAAITWAIECRRFRPPHRLAVALVRRHCATFAGWRIALAAHRAQQQAVVAELAASRAQALRIFCWASSEANSTGRHDSATAQQTPARELLDIGSSTNRDELRDQPGGSAQRC